MVLFGRAGQVCVVYNVGAFWDEAFVRPGLYVA
jgi:hypothetical protein